MRLRILSAILILAVFSAPSLAQAREAFQAGYKLFEEGKYYSAINKFKSALQEHSYPLLDYGYYYIAQAYQKKNNLKEARQVYEILVNHFKNSILVPKALMGIAECQKDQGQYFESAATLREFITLFPQHELIPQARYLLGINLEKMNKFVDAARIYRNLDMLHPSSYFAEMALERLDQLAKRSPLPLYEAPAASIYNLGIKYFQDGNYTKAKGYFTRLANFYKKSTFYDEALLMLGRIQLRKGKVDRAVNYFKKVINLDKDSKPEAMYYLGRSYKYLNSPKAAIRTLEKLVSMYPNSHSADDALYFLGYYYKEQGQSENRMRAYQKLVASYPNSEYFEEALWLIGSFYYKKGDYEAAYRRLSQAESIGSDRLLFWAAKCAEKLKKKEEAIKFYTTTIQRYDHSYYSYRAREELKKYGINIKVDSVPDVSEIIEEISGDSVETASHEEKYRELLALGLGDEAAEEASFLVEKVPLSKKDKARIAKYHAYVMKGKYAKPIQFADKKINEAMLAGALSSADPHLWRFSYPRGYRQYVEKYSRRYGLDPYLTYAVIREESRFRPRALSRSRAHGLMQIIPSTGRKLSNLLGMRYSRWKLYNPRVNIQMGTYYLAQLIKHFNGNVALALAGYNGGPVRVKKWLSNYTQLDIDEFIEDIPLRETRNYVKRVLKSYYGYKRTYGG